MEYVERKQCLGYRIYLIYNAIRFLAIGIIVYLANTRHNGEITEMQEDCCKCVNIADNVDDYDVKEDRRFDLSYCIPECTSCDFCLGHPNATSGDHCKFSDDTTTYSEPKAFLNIWISPSLDEKTGCDQIHDGGTTISLTSMYISSKSYKAYGRYSLGVGAVYFIAMGILLFAFKDRYDTISIFIYIYNIILAELNCYWIFKPYQYHKEQITKKGEDEVIASCQVDLITSTAEDILTVIIYVSFALLFLQIIYCILGCFKICKKCCCMWSKDDFRRQSITSHLIDEDGQNRRCDKDCCCYYLWIIIGIFVVIIMLCLAVVMIWAHIVMIKAHWSDNDPTKMVFIWVVNVFLFLSLFDIFFFPFCWKNIGRFMYHQIRSHISSFSSVDDDDKF